MKFRIGIRFQLIAGIVITTAAGMGLIGLFSIIAVERSAVYWKSGEAERVVKVLRVAQRGSGGFSNPDAYRYAAAALKQAGAAAIEMSDPSGKVIIREGALPAGEGEELPYGADVRIRRIGAGWLRGPGLLLYVTAPLDGAGARGARLSFTVSLAGIREETAGVRRFLLVYAVVDSLIIIGLGVYFLSRSIITPIRALTAAATRIAGGSLGERVREDVDNEIGSLAMSFNVMADKLEAEIKTLERVNAELVAAQAELLRSSTLAAIGNLAAGIAHEVGNPLGALSGYIDILKRGGSGRDEEQEVLGRAAAELGRIDAIVRDFLDVSRPPRTPKTPVDVNRVVAEAVSAVAAHPAFAGARADMKLTEGLPLVMIDRDRMRQVFMNLLLNAAQSMAAVDGARAVTVATSLERRPADEERGLRPLRRKDDRFLGASGVHEKEYAAVSFTDRGVGISAEDAGRIFEPFFTTKGPGGGTGLGLFVSHSIVKAYGGEITVASKPGEGSTFTVILPAGQTK
ncbi:MAG: HAMP domain-containing protein [Deltaproteobacteria bacterium]|nr:HAMP domain-containing protein [Deltaproteobacteria bacterium]